MERSFYFSLFNLIDKHPVYRYNFMMQVSKGILTLLIYGLFRANKGKDVQMNGLRLTAQWYILCL